MNAQFTEVIRKQYYKIGEASEMLKENTSCIRYWLNELDLSIRRNNHHYRMISRKTMAILFNFRVLLREEKYTIEGAKQKLREAKLI